MLKTVMHFNIFVEIIYIFFRILGSRIYLKYKYLTYKIIASVALIDLINLCRIKTTLIVLNS